MVQETEDRREDGLTSRMDEEKSRRGKSEKWGRVKIWQDLKNEEKEESEEKQLEEGVAMG